MRASLRFVVLPVVLAFALTLVRAAEERADELSKPFLRSPYLQFASPNLMHVLWRTWGPVVPSVRFGLSPSSLNETVSGDAIVQRASLGADGQAIPARWASLRTAENLKLPKLHSAPIGAFQYEARLSRLRPSTRYYYAIFDGNRRLTPSDPSYSFLTPPPAGTRQPVRFAVIGDSGTGRRQQLDVFQAMLQHVGATGQPLDFWIHVGDMAYGTGRDMEFQSRVFEPYEALMRNTVCWPAMGNHEGNNSKGTTGIGPYYDAYAVPTRGEAGGIASGTEAYYSFDHANIHFICLDSHDLERKPSGAMAKWLKADLERANADWLIAFWHHPPYTKGSHDSDKEKDLTEMRQFIMPIIESGGVDLVLTGHSHSYERSMLMDGAYATPTVSENVILDDGDGDPHGDGAYRKSAGIHPHEGTVQVVAGNGGQSLGRTGSLPVMKKIFIEHGSVVIDVSGNTLTAQMVNSRGSVRDLFSVVKEAKVQPQRLALPWQPPAYVKPENAPGNPATPAVDHKVLIPRNADWLVRTAHPQGLVWTLPGYPTDGWQSAKAGFGFGDREVQTRIERVPGQAAALYLRKTFSIFQADAVTELGLTINYSDGVIVYLNGHEVARVNIARSSGRNVQGIKTRPERNLAYLVLKDAHQHLRDGENVLAIEAHASPDALDFCVDPELLCED